MSPTPQGQRLREARESAGHHTAAAAARALQMEYQTYAGHENGKAGIRADMAQRYAEAFGVSIDWLLTGAGQGPRPDPQRRQIIAAARKAESAIQELLAALGERPAKIGRNRGKDSAPQDRS